MHGAVEDFVRWALANNVHVPSVRQVVEVGSIDVNGSARQFFGPGTRYVGCDRRAGKGVDVVCSGVDLVAELEGQADVVISTEVLEHDVDWQTTIGAFVDLARPGGLIVMTCAGPNRAPHSAFQNGPPVDGEHYRNLGVGDVDGPFRSAGADIIVAKLVREDMDLQVVARRIRAARTTPREPARTDAQVPAADEPTGNAPATPADPSDGSPDGS